MRTAGRAGPKLAAGHAGPQNSGPGRARPKIFGPCTSLMHCRLSCTRMCASAQRDVRPAKYKWRHLQKFRNSIPCTMYHATKFGSLLLPECHTVTLPIQENARLGCKMNFAAGKIPFGSKSPRTCIYSVAAQETAEHALPMGRQSLCVQVSREGSYPRPIY